jgi:hypothetical protein
MIYPPNGRRWDELVSILSTSACESNALPLGLSTQAENLVALRIKYICMFMFPYCWSLPGSDKIAFISYPLVWRLRVSYTGLSYQLACEKYDKSTREMLKIHHFILPKKIEMLKCRECVVSVY